VVRDHDAGVQREALTPRAQAFDTAHGRLAVLRRAPRRRRLGLDLCEHVDTLLHAVVAHLVGEPTRDPTHDQRAAGPRAPTWDRAIRVVDEVSTRASVFALAEHKAIAVDAR
jgi:hypothetical protein